MLRRIVPDVIDSDRVIKLPRDATVLEAARLMRDQNVGAVLVMEELALLGIFTERDMVTRVVAERRDSETTKLSEVMTADPDRVEADETAITALRMMDDGGYRHLPVIERGAVVGVVSRRDFSGLELAQLDEEAAIWSRIG